MGKINYLRVLIGGVTAAAVFIVTEFFIEGLAGILWGINETSLLQEYFPQSLQGGLRLQFLNLLNLLMVCMLLIWLYAALRPRFAAGPKTALICAFIFWFTELLLIMNLVNMNIFPWKSGLISLIFNAIELPVAALAGASIYQETASKK
jgi:hypothetical protein